MPLNFLAIAAAIALNWIPSTVNAISTEDQDESYFFLIPESALDGDDGSYVFDAAEDRILRSTINSVEVDYLSQGFQQSVFSRDWVVLPREVFAYTEASLKAPRSDLRLSFPEQIRAAPRAIVTSEDGMRFVKFTYGNTHYFLPAALVVNLSSSSIEELLSTPMGCEIVGPENPLPLDYVPEDLVRIVQHWNFHTADYPKHLRAEAAEMLTRMLMEAQRQNVQIRIFSAYRSSQKQRFLYLREIERSGLRQRTVAKPGHSEHQLGTTVDLCGLNVETLACPDFDKTRMGEWLSNNAARFGFRQSYTEATARKSGYIPEPWHYRYYGGRQ